MIILFLASALLCGSIYLNSNKIKRVPTWYASQRCVPCRFFAFKTTCVSTRYVPAQGRGEKAYILYDCGNGEKILSKCL